MLMFVGRVSARGCERPHYRRCRKRAEERRDESVGSLALGLGCRDELVGLDNWWDLLTCRSEAG
jgi:hypothetical protein